MVAPVLGLPALLKALGTLVSGVLSDIKHKKIYNQS